MSIGLLFDADQQVATFGFSMCKHKWMPFDRALGLLRDGTLVGAVIFQNYNGSNVEISYYGQNTVTPGIVRCLAEFVVKTFNPSRVTATVSKRQRRLIRSLIKLGFKVEGIQRCYYGKHDCNRNTGVRLVMFRDRIDYLARLQRVEAA